jgi:hypothetical protein
MITAVIARSGMCESRAAEGLQLIAKTDGDADDWLKLLPGIEGVVGKRDDGRYAQVSVSAAQSHATGPSSRSSDAVEQAAARYCRHTVAEP